MKVISQSTHHSMAVILKLLLLPISLLFWWIRDQIASMGGSDSKPEVKVLPAVQQNSSGFHVLEFHAATVGSGAIVLLIIVLICVFVCYGYGRLRRRCKKSMMRRYFGVEAQMSLPYTHQMQPLQPQTAIAMPAPALAQHRKPWRPRACLFLCVRAT